MDGASVEPSSQTRSVRLEDIGAQLEVRRHPGARRLTLRVSRTRRAVIVTLPLQCDLDEAGTFLNRHIDWVRARLDSLPNHVPFEDAAAMPLRGEPHTIAFTGRRAHAHRLDRAQKTQRPTIVVPGRARISLPTARRAGFSTKRGAISRKRRPPCAACCRSRRNALSSAIRRAVGDRARRRARCRSPGA